MAAESILASGAVKAAMALIVIPLALFILLLAVILVLARINASRPEVEASEKYKRLRYEAGNPMWGSARRSVSMQYLGYLIIFLAVEPALILILLASMAPPSQVPKLLLVLAAFAGVYVPLLIYAVKVSRRIELWTID